MNLVAILIFLIGILGLVIYWKKLPRLRDKIIWITFLLLLFAFISVDLFYPRITTFVSTGLKGGVVLTTVSANQIWLGIIIAVSMICVAFSGFVSYKKPNTSNRKIALIAIIIPIIVLMLFISDLFY